MNPQQTATTITEITPDAMLNLEQFLDDSFLEGEKVEERPIQLALHHSARGGGYEVQRPNQSTSR